ncbi:MAG: divergent PAP2 family protein [Treponema sp.]|nr:divergent PAP2 family protein [Treponema sp.]
MNSFYENFKRLLMNPVFMSAITSWFCAQFIKTIINLLSRRIKNIKELFELLFWRTGGMPSSHTALVCAISTSIGWHSGVDSDIFVLSICFMLVVVRDALGVRRASGVQAKSINEIGRALHKKEITKFNPIKEIHGHNPLEVVVGAILGVSIGVAFSLL